MKIAIIGGGWVGCHLANKLKDSHEVSLFEKNGELFKETSSNNQNRLHLGYHYARNHATRKLCSDTFSRFLEDYEFLAKNVERNLYCVPINDSILDYETYKQIFSANKIQDVPHSFKNMQGCVDTGEMYIDFKKASSYFNDILKEIIVNDSIDSQKLNALKKDYDLVINATNNNIKDSTAEKSFYELTISFIYEKIKEVPFGAVTLVDGLLFSIYPYGENTYTLTDVEHTPIKSFKSNKSLELFKESISTDLIEDKQQKVEIKVQKYFPEFLEHFKRSSYFISTKVKKPDMSADRYPVINKDGNVINCFTGKIQGIYIIEDFIKNEINNRT